MAFLHQLHRQHSTKGPPGVLSKLGNSDVVTSRMIGASARHLEGRKRLRLHKQHRLQLPLLSPPRLEL